MMSGSGRLRWTLTFVLTSVMPWACMDATEVELLEISATGTLFGQVFLDLDGSGGPSIGDEPFPDASVVLATVGTPDVVDQVTTDSLGTFTLFDVPVGTYTLALDAATLGDSLVMLGTGEPVTIELDDATQVDLGASFEELSLEDALAAPLGRRIFTSGIALNPRVNFGDGQVHFEGATAFLRALNVERSGLNVGDSVRLRGRVITDNGRPALDEVTPFVLVTLAALVTPTEVTTFEAGTADGGPLDAALVRIRDAEITDTSTTVDGHFRFWTDDGTDSVEFVIRDFLVPGVNTALFRPDTIFRIQQATGLLSPYDDGSGTVRWRFLPRGGSDITLEVKAADVGVTTSLDTAQASLGDTVEITVVTANAGPETATGVQVRDTIPTALGYLSSTTTVGSYSVATGIWDLGDLDSGSSDTLRISVEVTDGTPGIVASIAEFLGLTLEFEPNGFNDLAVAFLTIF